MGNRRPLILNSTSLIYLSKSGKLWILKELRGRKLITPQIQREVVDKGIKEGYPDAELVQHALEKEILDVVAPRQDTIQDLKVKGLHKGDVETLALAKEQEGIAIIDDKVERKVASMKNISFQGTGSLLLWAIKDTSLTKKEAKHTLDQMIEMGWRCSIQVYKRLAQKIEKI